MIKIWCVFFILIFVLYVFIHLCRTWMPLRLLKTYQEHIQLYDAILSECFIHSLNEKSVSKDYIKILRTTCTLFWLYMIDLVSVIFFFCKLICWWRKWHNQFQNEYILFRPDRGTRWLTEDFTKTKATYCITPLYQLTGIWCVTTNRLIRSFL